MCDLWLWWQRKACQSGPKYNVLATVQLNGRCPLADRERPQCAQPPAIRGCGLELRVARGFWYIDGHMVGASLIREAEEEKNGKQNAIH